jgi:hypothetical protein
MRARWKKYLMLHGVLLAIVAAFGLYALLMQRLFPNGYFHCVLHDLLHLYCPFCGGTRAFLALLRLDVLAALRLNCAILLAGVLLAVLDVRALILLCRKSDKPLLWPRLGRAAILYFGGYLLVINTLMLNGIDLAGDLAPYWQQNGTALGRALFAPLFALVLLLFVLATDLLPLLRAPRHRVAAAWACGYLSLALFAVLYVKWWLFFLYLPLTAGLFLYLRSQKNIFRL